MGERRGTRHMWGEVLTVIHLVRHGATSMNAQPGVSVDRERSWSNVGLTKEGEQSARKAGMLLKSKGIDTLHASDLPRSAETAHIIGNITGVKPQLTRGLRPWNLGEFANQDTKKIMPKLREYAEERPTEAVPGGESFNAFKARAFAELTQILAKHGRGKPGIATHHRVERLLAAYIKKGQPADHSIDFDEFFKDGDPPGGVLSMDLNDKNLGNPRAAEADDDDDKVYGGDRSAVTLPLDRSIFGYMEPRSRLNGDQFAQCGTCRMWIMDNERCYWMSRDKDVDDDDSCILYVEGPPIADDVMPVNAVTPETVGFTDGPVRCENCAAFEDGICQFYDGLNRANPAIFDLDASVKPKGCCNAFHVTAAEAKATKSDDGKQRSVPFSPHHALAIGGAHHLHKAGLISTQQRNDYQKAARQRLARAALKRA